MRRVLGVLAAMAAIAGCASSEPPAATPAPGTNPTAATASTATAPTGAVPAALDISAAAVGGGEIDLSAYAGRDLALWFWAPY